MDQRFPDEFVNWFHKTPVGVKVEEVFGMDSKSGKTWIELARQIYSESGDPNYRVIEHFDNGAPYLENYPGRISITHTDHFFAVATLPKTPEVNLDSLNPRTAMGIDAEPFNRRQVLNVRNKFLSVSEQKLIPENDLEKNVLAWTIKEALYKASFTKGIDFKDDLRIITLPDIDRNPGSKFTGALGSAVIVLPDDTPGKEMEMIIYSYESYGCCVSIALSNKCATFGKQNKTEDVIIS